MFLDMLYGATFLIDLFANRACVESTEEIKFLMTSFNDRKSLSVLLLTGRENE